MTRISKSFRALDRSYKFRDKRYAAVWSLRDNTIYLPRSHIPFDPANLLFRYNA